VASSRPYLQRHQVQPRELPLVGVFEPRYLVLTVDFESALWQAVTDWLRAYGSKPPPLDLSDPYDRMTAQALIVREHELAHFTAFIVNPLATTLQLMGLMRDLSVFNLARTLRNAGQTQLRVPLKNWQKNYELDAATREHLSDVAAQIQGYAAISGLLMYGLRGIEIPTSLRNSANRAFWPWILISEEVQKENAADRGISFRDVHEGLAVIAETRTMFHLGVSFDDYLELRRGLFGEYATVPGWTAKALGGWYEVTAGIVMHAAAVFPALAVLAGADDWQRFDATTCMTRTLAAARKLGPTLEYVQANKPLSDYVAAIFADSYPNLDPRTLLHDSNRVKIEAAFGLDELRKMDGITRLLPNLSWIEKTQSEISSELEWERQFLPFPLNTDRWWPAIIDFGDTLSRHTDIETYRNIRYNYINHRLADALFFHGDLSHAQEVCFGAIDSPTETAEGEEEVLSQMLEWSTGFSIEDVRVDPTPR
jgi:hypothetical protein